MGITFSSNSLKKQRCANAFCFWMSVWANVSPGVFWDYPVLMNFWSPVIGLAVSVHFDAFSEILLIQFTSNVAGEISWGFTGLMPFSKTVIFCNILVSFGNIHGSWLAPRMVDIAAGDPRPVKRDKPKLGRPGSFKETSECWYIQARFTREHNQDQKVRF